MGDVAGSPSSYSGPQLALQTHHKHLSRKKALPLWGWQLKQAVLLKPYVLHVVLPWLLGLLLPPPAAQGVGDVAPTHG